MLSIFIKFLLLWTLLFTHTLFADEASTGIQISNAVANEADGTMEFTVTIDELPLSLLSSVRVDYNTINGTALAGEDYEETTSNFFTAVWFTNYSSSTSKTITVPIIDNNSFENSEYFFTEIRTSSSGHVIEGTGKGTGTITDNEVEPLTLTLLDQSLTEGDSNGSVVSFTARLNQAAPVGGVTLDYKTSDNSAVAGEDYVAKNGTITIPEGSTDGLIPIEIIGDLLPESSSSEIFNLTITNITTATLEKADAICTIYDNDSIEIDITSSDMQEGNNGDNNQMEFRVFLKKPYPLTTALNVNYQTADGSTPSATAGVDYTAKNGIVTFNQNETEKIIKVDIIGDDVLEPDEYVKMIISGSSYIIDTESQARILNDDGDFPSIDFSASEVRIPEGNSGQKDMNFTMTLSQAAPFDTAFEYQTWDITAQNAAGDNDFIYTSGVHTIPAGETTATIAVKVNGDTKIEGDEEFYFVLKELTSLKAGSNDKVKGIIENDDGDYPILRLDNANYSIQEKDSGYQELNITLTLDQPAFANSTFHYFTQDATAKWSDSDYDILAAGNYAIEEGETKIGIVIKINGDTRVENNEEFQLIIDTPQNFIILGDSVESNITILNDDTDDTFSCSTDAYIFGSKSFDAQTDSYGFDLSDGTELSSHLNVHPSNINAIGYNVKDNYIWGYDRENYKVVQINKNYQVSSHNITGLPTFYPADDITPTYHAGDVSLDGILHLATITDPSTIYRVDVNPNSINYLKKLTEITLSSDIKVADFAFSPKDAMIYTVNHDEFLLKIDPTSGSVTNLGPLTIPAEGNVVSVFFDKDGNMYVHHTYSGGGADSGKVYKIVPPSKVQASITASYFSIINASDHGDGARCPYAAIKPTDEDPFVCDDGMYISSSVNRTNPTSKEKIWLHRIDTQQNPFDFLVLDDEGSSNMYNALAYSDVDNYIYGIYKKELVKLSRTGKVISLGNVKGLPSILTSKQLFAGAIYGDEYYISGPGQDYEKIYKINLLDQNVSEITLDKAISLLDFSFTPDGQLLHGIIDGGELVKIDVNSGKVSTIGSAHIGYQFDSTFSDNSGRFFANDSFGNGFFEFNLNTGEKLFLSDSQKAEFNDGANCLKADLLFTDYGDAPISYGTPRHTITNGLFLGSQVDHDIHSYNSIDAQGDDNNGIDDEDGITLKDGSDLNGSYFSANSIQELNVTVSKAGYLNAWIDYNIDGVFNSSDQIVTAKALSAGNHVVSFNVPSSVVLNKTTYLRFRFSSTQTLDAIENANDGEVEDYAVTFGSDAIKGYFNIERTNSDKYPINSIDRNAWYTQIVGRDFDYSLVFYNEEFTAEQNISNIVAKVELVDTKSDVALYERYLYIAENSANSRFTFDSLNSPSDDLSEQSNSSFPPIPASKDVHFKITYPKDSEGNIIQAACSGDVKQCFDKLTKTTTDRAQDRFAIRPDRYYVSVSNGTTNLITSQNTPASINLAAGYKYTLTTTATKYMTANPASGYTKTLNRALDLNTSGTCADKEPIQLSLAFTDGDYNTTTFSHKNVGKYILDLNDTNWTKIDQNTTNLGCIQGSGIQTADVDGKVGCNILTYLNPIEMNFQPHHFNVALSMNNLPNSGHPDFIYMMELNATNNNVAIMFEGNITAEDEDNNPTSNFTAGCVASNLLLDLNASTVSVEGIDQTIFTTDNITPVNFSRIIRFNNETNSTLFDVNRTISRIRNQIPILSSRFLEGDNNGSMSLDMRYNLNKNLQQAINPVEVTFNSIEVNSATASSSTLEINDHVPTGTATFPNPNNVTNFYFAKVVSDLNNYPEVNINVSPLIRTPLNVDIFCGTTIANYCKDRHVLENSNLTGTIREQNGWYLSSNHNGTLDGNVTELRDNPNILTITPDPTPVGAEDVSLDNGENGLINAVFNNCNNSHVTVTITTDPVLRFDPSEYTVNCTDRAPSQWTGIGQTGNVLNITPKVDKAGKMEW